jgi:hypothetical protein
VVHLLFLLAYLLAVQPEVLEETERVVPYPVVGVVRQHEGFVGEVRNLVWLLLRYLRERAQRDPLCRRVLRPQKVGEDLGRRRGLLWLCLGYLPEHLRRLGAYLVVVVPDYLGERRHELPRALRFLFGHYVKRLQAAPPVPRLFALQQLAYLV